MSETYKVKLNKFEGPIEILCNLIEKRKLQINTIGLSGITEDFINYTKKMDEIPSDEIAEFIQTASILILIKSKSLLPILEYTEEEKIDVEELEKRVRLYEYIKNDVASKLDDWEEKMFTPKRRKIVKKEIKFTPSVEYTTDNFHTLAKDVLRELRFFKKPPTKRVNKLITIDDIINKVMENVNNKITIHFTELTSNSDKEEKIVSFLAVLELFRKNIINAKQNSRFDEIIIQKIKI